MQPTIYDPVGRPDALESVVDTFHTRVLGDDELSISFTRPKTLRFNGKQVRLLAAASVCQSGGQPAEREPSIGAGYLVDVVEQIIGMVATLPDDITPGRPTPAITKTTTVVELAREMNRHDRSQLHHVNTGTAAGPGKVTSTRVAEAVASIGICLLGTPKSSRNHNLAMRFVDPVKNMFGREGHREQNVGSLRENGPIRRER